MGRSDAVAVQGSPADDHDVHADIARRDAHRRGARGRVMPPTLSARRRAARRILARLARTHSARRTVPEALFVSFLANNVSAVSLLPRVLETSHVKRARASPRHASRRWHAGARPRCVTRARAFHLPSLPRARGSAPFETGTRVFSGCAEERRRPLHAAPVPALRHVPKGAQGADA